MGHLTARNLVNDHLAAVVVPLEAANPAARLPNLLVVVPHLVAAELALRRPADEDAAAIPKHGTLARARLREGAPVFLVSDLGPPEANIIGGKTAYSGDP